MEAQNSKNNVNSEFQENRKNCGMEAQNSKKTERIARCKLRIPRKKYELRDGSSEFQEKQ